MLMSREQRRYVLNDVQRQIWDGWERGLSISEIVRVLPTRRISVGSIVRGHGGIRPKPRHRSTRALNSGERELICKGLAAGLSMREIARHLKRAPSTISREVKRHGGLMGYSGIRADESAWRRARRPRRCLLASNHQLRELVVQKLSIDWSPHQISGWLKVAHADDESMRISHETIYRTLFIRARGVLSTQLTQHLRRRQPIRIPRAARHPRARSRIPDALCINQRPSHVETRSTAGHWEGDLLCGNTSSQIATLVERKSRFLVLVKVPSKSTANVVTSLSRQVLSLPIDLRRSLTWDRGIEMTNHKAFTRSTNVPVYFCDPQSPWQRGSNENTNGLLRQYLPKGRDLSILSQEELDVIATRLNHRPRKTLDFRSPAEVLSQNVASTG
jgi:IS30 family transposase